jgi:hypothetical protein
MFYVKIKIEKVVYFGKNSQNGNDFFDFFPKKARLRM